MEFFINLLVLFIAMEHMGFLYLEMFLWTKVSGRRIFGNTKEDAEKTKILAANQGLYNGFLSVGLLWGLFHPSVEVGSQVVLFFLICIVIAGVYGGMTAKKTILYIQALPALITILLMIIV